MPIMLSAARLFSACVELASVAGEHIRAVHSSGFLGIHLKGENDPCTEADLRAQRVIESTLRTLFPQHPLPEIVPSLLLPTETYAAADLVVYVDPLDGTINFTKNELEGVTTLIGVCYKGRPIFGAVHAVFEAENPVYWGGPDLGIWRWTRGRSLPLDPPSCASSAYSVVSTKYHDTPAISQYLNSCGAEKVIRVGGSGSKGLMLLKGVVSAYVYPGGLSKKWDICANEALILGAGGRVTDMRGKEYLYEAAGQVENPGGFIETINQEVHAALVRANERLA